MKLKVGKYYLEIIVENEQDEAYINDTLGLKKGGDVVKFERVNATGLSCAVALRSMKYEAGED